MLDFLYQMFDVQTLLVFVVVFLGIILYTTTGLPKNFPPGPRPLPFVGTLLSMGKDRDKAHINMFNLSKKYGPVVGMKMGSYPAVILNGLEAIREVLVNNGDHYRNRPYCLEGITKICRPGGKGPVRGVTWTNGEIWKNSRRFTLSAMRDFGMGKRSIEEKIQEECVSMCNELMKVTGQPFDVQLLLQESVSNIICSICFGSRFEYTDPVFNKLLQMMRHNIQTDAISTASNFIPLLRMLPERQSFRNAMANAVAVDKWMETEIEKHRETYDPREIRDFVDLYLSNEKESDESLCPENMNRIISDIFIAGTDTTATSLRWMLLYLIHYPEVQTKCQKEIDLVIGSSRHPSLADRQDMPYLEGVIHETLRIGNIAAAGVPHSAEHDTTLYGYNIPKDTLVMPNLYSVHMDSKYFKDPEKFDPERWIGSDGKFQKNEGFVPFSMGPRACLGENLARSELFLFSTSMLQRFSFRMVDSNNPPSLMGKQGLIFSPRKFDIIIESR